MRLKLNQKSKICYLNVSLNISVVSSFRRFSSGPGPVKIILKNTERFVSAFSLHLLKLSSSKIYIVTQKIFFKSSSEFFSKLKWQNCTWLHVAVCCKRRLWILFPGAVQILQRELWRCTANELVSGSFFKTPYQRKQFVVFSFHVWL